MKQAALAFGLDEVREVTPVMRGVHRRGTKEIDDLHEKVAAFYDRLGFRRIPNSLLLVQRSPTSPTSPRPTTRAEAPGTSSPSAGSFSSDTRDRVEGAIRGSLALR